LKFSLKRSIYQIGALNMSLPTRLQDPFGPNRFYKPEQIPSWTNQTYPMTLTQSSPDEWSSRAVDQFQHQPLYQTRTNESQFFKGLSDSLKTQKQKNLEIKFINEIIETHFKDDFFQKITWEKSTLVTMLHSTKQKTLTCYSLTNDQNCIKFQLTEFFKKIVMDTNGCVEK
jgi:hypothetical protein